MPWYLNLLTPVNNDHESTHQGSVTFCEVCTRLLPTETNSKLMNKQQQLDNIWLSFLLKKHLHYKGGTVLWNIQRFQGGRININKLSNLLIII